MENKLKIHHSAAQIVDGELKIVETDFITYRSLDLLGEDLKNEVDTMINRLKENTKGHICTRAVLVHPLIHIPWDDVNTQNEGYQYLIKSEQN